MMRRAILALLLLMVLSAPIYAQRGGTDTDGDGVLDSADACPRDPGPASNRGCPLRPTAIPDSDGDGLVDTVDRCPFEAGPRENNGCPVSSSPQPTTPPSSNPSNDPAADRDGDGTPDSQDRCPDQSGPSDNGGCPIAQTAPPTESPVYRPAPPPDNERCYATPSTNNRVNVRAAASTSAEIIGALLPGSHLGVLAEVINPQGELWYEVALTNGTGFVADIAVEVQGPCDTLDVSVPDAIPQGGGFFTGLCYIDPSKAVGVLTEGSLDALAYDIDGGIQPDPANTFIYLEFAIVSVSQTTVASFSVGDTAMGSTLMVTMYTSDFALWAQREAAPGEVINIPVPAGDYYWNIQTDATDAILSIACGDAVPFEEASTGVVPVTPDCAVWLDVDADGNLGNPVDLLTPPFAAAQNTPNDADFYVTEYYISNYSQSSASLTVTANGADPVTVALFKPLTQVYDLIEQIDPNTGIVNLPLPALSMRVLEVYSSAPFDFTVQCAPDNAGAAVPTQPEPQPFIVDLGNGSSLFGFEGYTPQRTDPDTRVLTPADSALPPLVFRQLGDGSVRVENGVGGNFIFGDGSVRLGDGSVRPTAPTSPQVLFSPGLLMGDGSVIPIDLLPGDGSVAPPPLPADPTVPVVGMLVNIDVVLDPTLPPTLLGSLVIPESDLPDMAFVVGGGNNAVEFGIPAGPVELAPTPPDACIKTPASNSGAFGVNPNIESGLAGFSNVGGSFISFGTEQGKTRIVTNTTVTTPARLTFRLSRVDADTPPTFDLSNVVMTLRAVRSDGGQQINAEAGVSTITLDVEPGTYKYFEYGAVLLGPVPDNVHTVLMRFNCAAR